MQLWKLISSCLLARDNPVNRDAFLDHLRPLVQADWLEPCVDLVDRRMRHTGSHDFGHLLRVVRNAARICEAERRDGAQIDGPVLAAAAILHDVVDLPKDDPDRHLASTRSADLGAEFFAERGNFDARRRDNLHHTIRAHSFSAGVPARSLEAQILADADHMEALGAFGVARVFSVSGQLGRSICDTADPFAQKRPLDDLEYAVDHFFTKLLTLEKGFHTATGRRLAGARHDFMVQFLEQLADELGVDAPLKA